MALLWLAAACQSVQQFSIDYMLPAEVSFPASLRRVGVVNNMSASSGSVPPEAEVPKDENEIARKTDYYIGNSAVAAESLTQALADGNYFDEVVICDSALRAGDVSPREAVLSREEVNTLARDLGVDFLIALEDLPMRSTAIVGYLPDVQAYYGTVDVKVYPTFRIYVPNRRGPLTTIQSADSIYWEDAGLSVDEVQARLVSPDKLVQAASEFAGTTPVRYLLPHWKSAPRYLFTGGSVDMRDAAVYVREQNWEAAIRLWKRHYGRKEGRQKMYAACNIALGYEMQDSLEAAAEWAEKARQAAANLDQLHQRQADGLEASDVPNYVFTTVYLNELLERKQGLSRLHMQMQRFKEDF